MKGCISLSRELAGFGTRDGAFASLVSFLFCYRALCGRSFSACTGPGRILAGDKQPMSHLPLALSCVHIDMVLSFWACVS